MTTESKNNEKDLLLFEFFLDKIENTTHLNLVVMNILNKNLPEDLINKFILWFHKKGVLDTRYISCLNTELINKMYTKISNESIIKLIESIDTKKNPCIIECNICKNDIENAHCYECGHMFCLDCITKHKRSIRLRNIEYTCPQCRKVIVNNPIKLFF